MKKKVLILTNYIYGTLRFHSELISSLLEEHEVYISAPKHEYNAVAENMGCNVIPTEINRRGKNPVQEIKLIKKYIDIIKEVEPDIVLTYSIKSNTYGSIACRLTSTPYINNINGLGSSFLDKGLIKKIVILLYKIALKKSSCVFFQNTYGLELFNSLKILKTKCRMVPGSGVNLQKFPYTDYPDEKSGIKFNFIGRVMQDKGIEEYLKAAEYIKNKYSNTEFRIIGFIEESEIKYKEIIKGYEKKGIVKYLGHRTDIEKIIKESHCLIHPSYSEGMANVILETAAIGRAIIASNIPGCREAVDENKTGYLFESKNVSKLTEKIEMFLSLSATERKQLGVNGHGKMSNEFDRNIVVDAYLEEIKRVIY